MNKDYKYWKQLHDDNALDEFNSDRNGLLWLKIKSITRKGIIQDFIGRFEYEVEATTLTELFKELFYKLSEIESAHEQLDEFMIAKNEEIVSKLDVEYLVSELYKLKHFDWGGDYQNALDKYLVSRYVKAIQSFDKLTSKLETEIVQAVSGYVFCSWYNHWTSILIEHLFKLHKAVIPTVGQIRSVDFFISDIPFDLKVTYLPANFVESQRKKIGLRPELTFLKQTARANNITFDKTASKANIYYEITEKLQDKGATEALDSIKQFRSQLVEQIKSNPKILAQNLYEEQGEMRFGAENRLFVVLVDKNDYDNSWKLKRNLNLLKPKIHEYLDIFHQKNIDDLKLSFFQKGNPDKYPKQYHVLTDVIVIEREK